MDKFLYEAFKEAQKGLKEGGIPIGSVLVNQQKIIGKGYNKRIQNGSVIHHAEMDALENAGRLPSDIYKNSILYTTLSPCSMCSGAILLYKIPKVVIGENISYKGEEKLLRERGVEIVVVNSEECIKMMETFKKSNPKLWNEDIGN